MLNCQTLLPEGGKNRCRKEMEEEEMERKAARVKERN